MINTSCFIIKGSSNHYNIYRGYGGLKSETSNFKEAIDVGFRFFDGAYAYNNDSKLRTALEEKRCDLNSFIISSKIPGSALNIQNLAQSTEDCFNDILFSLGIKKINILYLHGPDCFHKEVFETLIRLKNEDKIEYIGVRNIDIDTLKILIKANYPINVVQNEVNPYYWDKKVVEYCKENNIYIVGYSPFGNKEIKLLFEDENLKNLAKKI
jgi:diketogulonate reductase-like aldo/keto reductase